MMAEHTGEPREGRSPMGWHRELLVGFDLETTGTDPLKARIVTAAVTKDRDGEPRRPREWLVAPRLPTPHAGPVPHAGAGELWQLPPTQIGWYAARPAGYQKFLARQGGAPAQEIDTAWPLRAPA